MPSSAGPPLVIVSCDACGAWLDDVPNNEAEASGVLMSAGWSLGKVEYPEGFAVDQVVPHGTTMLFCPPCAQKARAVG